MTSLLRAILQTGIFMICAQAFLHFRPNGSYEKYMKMLVSIMVLIQIFLPVFNFFAEGGGGLEARIGALSEEMSRSMLEAQRIAAGADQILSRMTLGEVRERLSEREEEEAEEEDARNADEGAARSAEDGRLTAVPREGAADESGAEKEAADAGIHIDRIRIESEEGVEDEGNFKEME